MLKSQDRIVVLLMEKDRYMTILEIADELDLSYNHVARTLSKMYWKKPYPMTRWKQGRKVNYRWRNSS